MDRDLDGVDPGPPQGEGQHLRVVVVVADPRGRESAGGQGAVARLSVARDGAEQETEQRAGAAVRERPVPRHAIAPTEEARAEHVVGAAARDRLEHALEVGRVVLAVAVKVDGGGVALVARDFEPRSQRRPEPARALVGVDAGAVLAADRGRGVARAVVHEQHVHGQPARLARDAGEHAADGRLLVAGYHDGKAARSGAGAHRLHRSVLRRHQRPAARGLGLRHAEQAGDGRRQLQHRARFA
jgi:hypothetical protein